MLGINVRLEGDRAPGNHSEPGLERPFKPGVRLADASYMIRVNLGNVNPLPTYQR
jgi:hypothetical protein